MTLHRDRIGTRKIDPKRKCWTQEVWVKGERYELWGYAWADLDNQLAQLGVKK